MTFRSAYLRLTLWYTLIVMIISVVFSLALYAAVRHELEHGPLFRTVNTFTIGPNNQFPDGQIMIREPNPRLIPESEAKFALYLVEMNILVLGLASILSYFLAQKTLEPIREMTESQIRFTADASHELRTPLTALKTEIEVALRDKNLNLNQAKKLLESNLEEVEKLSRLSNDLLQLVRQTTTSNAMEDCSIEEIVAETTEKMKKVAEKRDITIKTDVGKNQLIRGNKNDLSRLLLVMLDNAIKYSYDRGKVEIKTVSHKSNLEIQVIDHGIGITAEDLPHLFERFYRADESRSRNENSGYGLGLAIAKQIAEHHRGHIAVSSQPGQGSIFTVILPY